MGSMLSIIKKLGKINSLLSNVLLLILEFYIKYSEIYDLGYAFF
jgi:hypothetical protein